MLIPVLYRDEKYLEKLREMGLSHEDEDKLAAMREYIWKLSQSRQRARPKGRENEAEGISKVRGTQHGQLLMV